VADKIQILVVYWHFKQTWRRVLPIACHNPGDDIKNNTCVCV